MLKHYCIVIYKEIVTESFAVTDVTVVTGAALFVPKVRAAVSTPVNALNVILLSTMMSARTEGKNQALAGAIPIVVSTLALGLKINFD